MAKYEKEDFVTIPVPKSRAQEVYRMLGKPKAIGASSPTILKKAASSPAVIGHADIEWWTKDRISKLKHKITNPTLIDLLDLLSRHPGEWVDFDELCHGITPSFEKRVLSGGIKNFVRSDMTPGEIRGSLGGLTRIIKRIFRDNKYGDLPFAIRRTTTPAAYQMPVEIAERWREA